MKKYFFMAMLAIAALGSCSKYDELEQIRNAGEQALTFTATTEGSEGTRAIYNSEEKRTEWEVGDKISVNGKIYSAKTAGSTTTFEATGMEATGDTYKAYFPADLYDGTKATLPEVQKYSAGKFDMPMYAQSTSTELHFKNLCAVLAIKVTSADINKLKSIKVASDKKMSGTFTVDENNTAVITADATYLVELKCATALTLTAEGTTFYIAIPAQKYQYLNIFLSSDGYHYTQAMATKKATGIGTLERSKIYNIDYKKNATKLWKGSLFIADCNVGATSDNVNGGLYTWGGANDAKQGYVDDHHSAPVGIGGNQDTAYNLWGSNWRMPTEEELEKLDNLGRWDATNKGLQCNSTDYSGNSVFLPAAGYCGSDGKYYSGTGDYWSSTPTPMNDKYESNGAYWLHFFTSDVYKYVTSDPNNRALAYSVRAVLVEAKGSTTGKAWSKEGNVQVNWVQLWEDGPKFAEYNVGVTDGKAENPGGLYTWGGYIDKRSHYSDDDYYNYHNGSDNLSGDLDTATKLWGSNWRMPTQAELQGLIDNCITVWTEDKTGVYFYGKDRYLSNSVFFPIDEDNELDCGIYGSSTYSYDGWSTYVQADLGKVDKGPVVLWIDDIDPVHVRPVVEALTLVRPVLAD